MHFKNTVMACCLSYAVFTPGMVAAQETATDEEDIALTTESIEESIGHDDETWADESHVYIGNKADDLAIYLDRFFGAPIEDLENADSTIRVSAGYRWDEDRGNDTKFRLRGNVHLPRVNERLSLVFNGEDEDGDNYAGSDDNNQAGLQFKAAETDTGRSRFDMTLSVSSGVNLKPGVRYRFKNDLGDRSRFRYTGRAFYSDKDRFQHKHLIDLDYQTGETSLIRWSNKVKRGDRTDGTEWRSTVSWRYGYSLDSAVAFVVGVTGKTAPEAPDEVGEGTEWPPLPDDDGSLITNYGAIIKFRNRLYKDWLFIEFEPGYTERKRNHYDERHGVFIGKINFEILFNRGRQGKARDDQQEVSFL